MAPADVASSTNLRALIIGATGGFGHAVAECLVARGWSVTALHRDPTRARAASPTMAIEWAKGDAMSAADVIAAAKGANAIFHAANPPRYRKWRELAIPMLQNAIAAAKASGARLIFPGNVYNFGPDAGSVVDETAPQNPRTRKGAVRVEMEKMLAAAASGGVRSIVIRAGDFLASVPGSWLNDVIVKGRPVQSLAYPGKREVGHTWAYLPDLAETIARIAEMERDLAPFEAFHFGGHWIEPGVDICEAVRRVTGRPDLPIRAFPWIAVYAGAPFVTLMRELIEMRYLWQTPLRLDDAKLERLLGKVPHTPLDDAVAATLRSMGAMPPASASVPA
jgi:nucleoside-diphosphate-sugar epimerase